MMKRDWWDREFRTLLTLGESTTAGGWSSCRERCWASQLARQINEVQRHPVQFVNEVWSQANLDVFHQYNDAIRQVAEQDDCLFVDLLASYRNADWLVHHDGCHANDLGHRIVANKIFEVLASNCSGLSLATKALERDILPWRDESTLQQ